MPGRTPSIAALALFAACLATGGATAAPIQPPPADPAAARAWTLIMYDCADSNLDPDIMRDLDRMEAAVPEEGVEVIVLVDRAAEGAERGGFNTARTYRLRRDTREGTIGSPMLDDLGEVNMGDPAVLRRFAAAALSEFPARRYGVFLSGHGSGWRGCCTDDMPATERRSDRLTPCEARDALRGALIEAGLPGLDLLVLNNCLMAQLEVLHTCRDLAGILVAAESVTCGFDRAAALPHFADPAATTSSLARRLVEASGRRQEQYGITDGAIAAIDSGGLPAVTSAFDALARRIYPLVATEWAPLTRAFFFAESFGSRTDWRNESRARSSADLLDLARRIEALLGDRFPAARELRDLEAAIPAAVIARYAGEDRPRSHGISVHAPLRFENHRDDYRARRPEEEIADLRGSVWPHLLEQLHRSQQVHGRRPAILDTRIEDRSGAPLGAIRPLEGARVAFELSGTNVLWILLDHGVRRPDGSFGILYRTFHAESAAPVRGGDRAAAVIPSYPDGRSRVTEEVEGLVLVVEAGGRTFEATVEATDPDAPATARVGAMLTHPDVGRDLAVEIRFSTRTGKTLSVLAREAGTGDEPDERLLETVPADARLRFLIETDSPERGVRHEVGDEVAWGKGPRLAVAPAPAGDGALFVRAESVAGNSIHRRIDFRLEHGPGLRDRLEALPRSAAGRLFRPGLRFREIENPGAEAVPPPLVPLQGRWRDSDGDGLDIRGDGFVTRYSDGTEAGRGRLAVEGDQLTVVPESGRRSVWRFRIAGDRLELTDSAGGRRELRRLRDGGGDGR